MGGSPYRYLRMFGELCGDQAVKKVVLVTTMWDKGKTDLQTYDQREKELFDNYWKTIINYATGNLLETSTAFLYYSSRCNAEVSSGCPSSNPALTNRQWYCWRMGNPWGPLASISSPHTSSRGIGHQSTFKYFLLFSPTGSTISFYDYSSSHDIHISLGTTTQQGKKIWFFFVIQETKMLHFHFSGLNQRTSCARSPQPQHAFSRTKWLKKSWCNAIISKSPMQLKRVWRFDINWSPDGFIFCLKKVKSKFGEKKTARTNLRT